MVGWLSNRDVERCTPSWRTAVRWAWALSALLLAFTAAWAQPANAPAVDPAVTAPVADLKAIPAARQAQNIAIITLRRDALDWVDTVSVTRRIKEAEAGGADAIVLEIDTYGGEVVAALEMCTAIENSSKPVYAWVNTKAYSAGSIIALACREILVTSNSVFGDAAPIAIDRRGQLQQLPDTERAKLTAPILTQIVSAARRNGYDEKLVQGLVMLGVELWLVQRDDTGERFTIDRNEYRYLFGSEPPPATPALSGEGGRAFTNSAQPVSTAPTSSGDASDFVPASPGVKRAITEEVAKLQREGTARPLPNRTRRDLAPGDVGQWRVIKYVADGSGLFTLKPDQMREFGLSSGIVDNDEAVKAFFAATNVTRLEYSWVENAVVFLDNRIVKGVLIVIFLLGLFIEMTHPGLTLPGIVSAIAILLVLGPSMMLGIGQWWQLAAVAIGIACIAMEIFVLPGFGVFGVVGLIALFAGLLGSFTSPGQGMFPDSAEGQSSLLHGVVTLVISTGVAIALMYFAGKNLGRLPVVNRLVLNKSSDDEPTPGLLEAMAAESSADLPVGSVGRALTTLRPSGRVEVGDRVIDVVADMGFIPAGQTVRITSVSAFRITVEPVSPDGRNEQSGLPENRSGPAGGQA